MTIKERIYEDYFKSSRLSSYRDILTTAKQNDYLMVGMLDFWKMVQNNEINNRRILINRHDIDTSPRVAREMFDIERDVYGREGSASYYLRLSTIDSKLIKEIESYGYETGYHYEELATLEKTNKLKDAEKLKQIVPQAQELFCNNLKTFRDNTGSLSLSVASHGDFINTRYQVQNHVILQDEFIRKKMGIQFEAYDSIVNNPVEKRFADHQLLGRFPNEVTKALNDEVSIVMILTHPRNWKVDYLANTIDNCHRIIQGGLYKI